MRKALSYTSVMHFFDNSLKRKIVLIPILASISRHLSLQPRKKKVETITAEPISNKNIVAVPFYKNIGLNSKLSFICV